MGGALDFRHGGATTLLPWALFVGEGSEREQSCLLSSGLAFSHFLHYPQANWALLVLIPWWVVCVHSRTLWVCPTSSPARLGVSPTAATGFSSQRLWGFTSLCWNSELRGLSHSLVVPPGLSACKCGTSQSASCHLAHPCPSATALPWVLSTQLPISTPPTSLDECYFFISLVVGPPYSSIFCQFWLFFVFKFVVVLVLVVQGGTVYLRMPPSWLEVQPHF